MNINSEVLFGFEHKKMSCKMCENVRQKCGHTKRHARPPGHIAAEIISNSNMLHTSEVNTVYFFLVGISIKRNENCNITRKTFFAFIKLKMLLGYRLDYLRGFLPINYFIAYT